MLKVEMSEILKILKDSETVLGDYEAMADDPMTLARRKLRDLISKLEEEKNAD